MKWIVGLLRTKESPDNLEATIKEESRGRKNLPFHKRKIYSSLPLFLNKSFFLINLLNKPFNKPFNFAKVYYFLDRKQLHPLRQILSHRLVQLVL